MSRLVLALTSAFALAVSAADPKPLPARLDPSNPDGPESPPLVASNTLAPFAAAGERVAASGHSHHGAADAGTAQVFACPMHPEEQSDKPGSCPKCGMTLVPAEHGAAEAGMTDEHAHHGATR